MRILFIAHSYYPHIGGVEYVVKSVAERLARAGHEIVVVAGEPSTDKPREDVVGGVRVIRWPVWSPGNAYHIPRKRSELEKLLKELAREVGVVHVHSVHSIFTVYAGLVIADSSASPRIVVAPHYHGTGHTFVRRVLWTFWRWRVAELLKKASVVHAVSRREASILTSRYPEARSKIVVIPNGVDADVFKPMDQKLTRKAIGLDGEYYLALLYSSLDVWIDIVTILKIISKMRTRFDIRLLIVGFSHAGHYYKALLNLIKRFDLDKYTYFYPPQPYEKYPYS